MSKGRVEFGSRGKGRLVQRKYLEFLDLTDFWKYECFLPAGEWGEWYKTTNNKSNIGAYVDVGGTGWELPPPP